MNEKAVEFRDKIVALVNEVGGKSQEDHVVRCCLALSLEALEEWIYNGEFSPSVEPTNSDGFVYFREETTGEVFRGKTIESMRKRHPTVARLKKEGKLDLKGIKMETREWNEMEPAERLAFLEGDRKAFIAAVRWATGCGIKSAQRFCKRMRMAHFKQWGSKK